jgi:DHA1 family bicyclomycin/chloramphenicol resistance-like MFS transporter
MFFVTLAVGLVMSNAVGQALAPYPKMAGAASSLLGFCQMGIAALVGMLVGHGVDGAATVLPMTVAGCALLVPLCHLALVRHPAP